MGRVLVALCLVVGLATGLVTSAGAASPSPPAQLPAGEAPPAKANSTPRRVIILGTTIVGDVLKPPIEKTVPWQRPAAFRSSAAPLNHDFATELLTPLDRNAILRDGAGHEH